MGLFTASMRVQGSTAIYTRQNPNGYRSGFECPEERDYYPHWGACHNDVCVHMSVNNRLFPI